MKHAYIFAAAVCLIGAMPSFAAADQARKGMSQLDFDQPPAAQQGLTKDQFKQILEESDSALPPAKTAPEALAAKAVPAAKIGKNDTAEHTDRTVRASLAQPSNPSANTPKVTNGIERFDWLKPEEGSSHYLTPKLRGPVVDVGSDTVITTSLTWKREGASCADVNSMDQLIRKAKALKELLNRFSGNDEFFERQCDQKCSRDGDRPLLTGFAVRKVPEGDFKMTETNGTCQYLIRSNVQPPRWQMLEGERGTCTCLPTILQ